MNGRLANLMARLTRAFTAAAVVVTLLTGAAMLTRPALAQSPGAPRGQIVKALGDKYDEAPVAIGLDRNGAVIEVFSSVEGDTWTILLTTPNGVSRVVASGTYWSAIAPLVGDPT